MKKKKIIIISSIVLVLAIVIGLFLLTGCTPKENVGTSTGNNKVQSNNNASDHLWDNPEYSEYTLFAFQQAQKNRQSGGFCTMPEKRPRTARTAAKTVDAWCTD